MREKGTENHVSLRRNAQKEENRKYEYAEGKKISEMG